jgi:hypothetical protein
VGLEAGNSPTRLILPLPSTTTTACPREGGAEIFPVNKHSESPDQLKEASWCRKEVDLQVICLRPREYLPTSLHHLQLHFLGELCLSAQDTWQLGPAYLSSLTSNPCTLLTPDLHLHVHILPDSFLLIPFGPFQTLSFMSCFLLQYPILTTVLPKHLAHPCCPSVSPSWSPLWTVSPLKTGLSTFLYKIGRITVPISFSCCEQ